MVLMCGFDVLFSMGGFQWLTPKNQWFLWSQSLFVSQVVLLWCDVKNTANIFASPIMKLPQVINGFVNADLMNHKSAFLLAIIPRFRGKVGGLLHRSRENATFSAIIPEFCSVFRGLLQARICPLS